MCILYTNTFWLCHSDGCKPEGKKQFSKPYDDKPQPFLEHCSVYNVTGVCNQPVTKDDETVFHRAVLCPTHHKKMVKNLEERLNEEWDAVTQARLDDAYRQRAGAYELVLRRVIERKFRELYRKSEETNQELYLTMERWHHFYVETWRKMLQQEFARREFEQEDS